MTTSTRIISLRRLSLAAAISLFGIGTSQAAEFQAGDWTLNVGGFVNAYYTYVDCDGATVGGLALAGEGLGCGGADSRSTIGNGLLPNGLITSFSGNQGGYDIGGTIAIMVHTATSSSIAPNSGVDVRQAFFTIGNKNIGTFKLGRDYGVFGANAILTDMTLVGVGMPIQATQRGRVSPGHIGAGYSYLGHYGQMTWTSAPAGGFGTTIGVMSPVGNGGSHDAGTGPQLQAQLSYAGDGFKTWLGAKTQKFEAVDPLGDDFTMRGVEAGVSASFGAASLLANIQSGKGLGILADGDNVDAKSTNWLVQGAYQTTEKLKLGLNYGVSRHKDDVPATGGLKQNANVTAGAYYALTPAVKLVFELSQTRSKAFNGNQDTMNGVSFGGIVFF